MQESSDGNDTAAAMDVNASNSQSNVGGRAAAGGRATHWAVSVQPVTARPAACKRCGDSFEGEELRICTWGDRKMSRWIHPLCFPSDPASVTRLSPCNGATEANVTAVRALWQTQRQEVNSLSEDAAIEKKEADRLGKTFAYLAKSGGRACLGQLCCEPPSKLTSKFRTASEERTPRFVVNSWTSSTKQTERETARQSGKHCWPLTCFC